MFEKLDLLNIKISELAQYLNISRPTLYKFIEFYEANKKLLRKQYLELFDYINNNQYLTKIDVIKYIIEKFNKPKKLDNEELNNLISLLENDSEYEELIKVMNLYLTNLNAKNKKDEITKLINYMKRKINNE